MSTPAQTPGPKRFLSHSKPSQSRSQPSSAARKPRFVRPSQFTSSSPYLTTPHAQQPKQRDDIDLDSDEGEEDTSPAPAQPHRFEPPQIRYHDSTEDTLTKDFATRHDADIVPSYGHADEQIIPLDHAYDVIANEDLSSPLRKRQKRECVNLARPDGYPLQTTSSPSGLEQDDDDVQRDDHDMNEDVLSSAEAGLPTKSKFKMPTPAQFPSPGSHTKLGFRPFLQPTTRPGSTFADSPLPEAFSPSRRKGTRGYLYGGMAETVRNWVLEIANEEQLTSDRYEGDILQVVSHSKDPSNRFEIVRDQDGKEWMMVHQQERSSLLLHTHPNNSVKKVRLRGKSTRWDIDLDDETSIGVAVLWDEVK